MDTYNEIKKGILECSGRNECGLRPEYIKGEEGATNYNAFQFNYSRQDTNLLGVGVRGRLGRVYDAAQIARFRRSV